MATGRMVRFDETRGYGFITPDSGGDDVFVHANALLDDKRLFSPGAFVEFDAIENNRGAKAVTVRLVRNAPTAGQHSEPRDPVKAPAPTSEDVCDVLSTAMFVREVTEVMLESSPALTAAQILVLRQRLCSLAGRHGWIED